MDSPIPAHRASGVPATTRLRRGAALVSASVLCALLAAFALWTFLAGGSPGDMSMPLAGAVLAFAAEMLCLDAAIRLAERRLDPAGQADALRLRPETSA